MTSKELESFLDDYFKKLETKLQYKQWMSLKEAAQYAGVSYNKFLEYRKMGLEFVEIDRIKKVSKCSIDEFYQKHSF